MHFNFFFLVGGGLGRRLFETGRLLTFSTFRVGTYLTWALIRGWALNRINTLFIFFLVRREAQKGLPNSA